MVVSSVFDGPCFLVAELVADEFLEASVDRAPVPLDFGGKLVKACRVASCKVVEDVKVYRV